MSCDVEYEELAAFADADLDPARLAEIRRHLSSCQACRRRLELLKSADAGLAAAKKAHPPVEAVLAARRVVEQVIRPVREAEIMTLEETAEFLRITPEQLGEMIEALPAFELAGQVRVRRQRLIEWIQQRERDFTRQANESWVARARVVSPGKGVA